MGFQKLLKNQATHYIIPELQPLIDLGIKKFQTPYSSDNIQIFDSSRLIAAP